MLQHATDEPVRLLLLDLCQRVVSFLVVQGAPFELMKAFFTAELRTGCWDAFYDIQEFSKMVLNLLMAPGADLDVAIITSFLNSKSGNSFKTSVQGIVSPMACPADSDEAQIEAQHFWQGLAEEAIRTAGSAATLRPQMLTLLSRLQGCEAMDAPPLDAILEASEKIANFRQGLRRSEVKHFVKCWRSELLKAVDRLTTSASVDGDSPPLTSAELEGLDNALKALGNKDDAVLAAQEKLMKFATVHNKVIAQQDLKAWCMAFSKAVTDAVGKGEDSHVMTEGEVSKLKEILSKTGIVQSEIQAECVVAVRYALQEILAEVRCSESNNQTPQFKSLEPGYLPWLG